MIDKNAMRVEIFNLEKAVLTMNENAIMVNHSPAFYQAWEAIKVPLNAAKFDYERDYGRPKSGWLLQHDGTPNK